MKMFRKLQARVGTFLAALILVMVVGTMAIGTIGMCGCDHSTDQRQIKPQTEIEDPAIDPSWQPIKN